MEQEITFRIILKTPPPGIDFALQKGKGSAFETIQKQRSAKGDLSFDAVVKVKTGKDGQPDFAGPLVQGPAGERFIYIGIGTFAGQADSAWQRRLKIPLRGITTGMLQQTAINDKTVLHTIIEGTGKDGTPTCGTAKPFAGWKFP